MLERRWALPEQAEDAGALPHAASQISSSPHSQNVAATLPTSLAARHLRFQSSLGLGQASHFQAEVSCLSPESKALIDSITKLWAPTRAYQLSWNKTPPQAQGQHPTKDRKGQSLDLELHC